MFRSYDLLAALQQTPSPQLCIGHVKMLMIAQTDAAIPYSNAASMAKKLIITNYKLARKSRTGMNKSNRLNYIKWVLGVAPAGEASKGTKTFLCIFFDVQCCILLQNKVTAHAGVNS